MDDDADDELPPDEPEDDDVPDEPLAVVELDGPDEVVDPVLLDDELVLDSFLVLLLDPLSLLSASRVDPKDPAERLSVL